MKKELIFSITKKDLDVQTFCSGGPGGQNHNKVASGVRIVHRESGAVGESRQERSQFQNKKIAIKRLTESKKFKIWISHKSFEHSKGKTIERMVDEMIADKKNIKIETKNEKGQWIEVKEIPRD